jgi:threonine synthase
MHIHNQASEDRYFCTQCHRSEEIKVAQWKCSCGGLLQIKKGVLDFQRDENNKNTGLWRYAKLISAFNDLQPISLGEGNTPITSASWENKEIHLKWEGMLPTGSYKDRGATAMISMLSYLGVKSIVEDSSGNAGAAIAWYAKMAGIPCEIFVPAHASGGKLNTIAAAGANLRVIPGERENASIEAMKAANDSFYASHVWCPFFIEGVKTLAYELHEQLGKNLVQRIILPVGNGALLLGLFKGLAELLAVKKINFIPELIAVQAENCAPLYHEFHGIPPEEHHFQKTLAEGIANRFPPRLKEIMTALQSSRGTLLKVREEEIHKALLKALGRGWMIEPTSAVSLAGLNQLDNNKSTLVIISGSGLKINEQLAGIVAEQAKY